MHHPRPRRSDEHRLRLQNSIAIVLVLIGPFIIKGFLGWVHWVAIGLAAANLLIVYLTSRRDDTIQFSDDDHDDR